jgi:transcriptional regulator of heat shock response
VEKREDDPIWLYKVTLYWLKLKKNKKINKLLLFRFCQHKYYFFLPNFLFYFNECNIQNFNHISGMMYSIGHFLRKHNWNGSSFTSLHTIPVEPFKPCIVLSKQKSSRMHREAKTSENMKQKKLKIASDSICDRNKTNNLLIINNSTKTLLSSTKHLST